MYALVSFVALFAVANAGGMFGGYGPMFLAPAPAPMVPVTISQPQQVISVQPPPRYVYGPQETIVQQPPPRYVHIETPPRIVEVERPVIQTVRQNVYVPVDRHITQTYVRPVYRHVVVQPPPPPPPAPIVVEHAPAPVYAAPAPVYAAPAPVYAAPMPAPMVEAAPLPAPAPAYPAYPTYPTYPTAWKKA